MSLNINLNGYLDAGLHHGTYIDFKDIFLSGFKTSLTRKDIFVGLFNWFEQLLVITEFEEVWLDGSFVSDKINPNDIDFCCFFDRSQLTNQNLAEIKKLTSDASLYKCDAYIGIINNASATAQDINNRNYWRGQFGFDRADIPKGILVLSRQQIEVGIDDVRRCFV